MLLMTLEETAQLDAEVDKLLAAWRSGDIESLSKTLSEEYERFPELYGPLTENRNRAWVPQLVDLLDDDDDYLVVVGALHLVGRNSVDRPAGAARLRRRAAVSGATRENASYRNAVATAA